MFMFDKPKSGTGATLLVSLVGLLTTGKHPERVTYCNGEMVEFEKRVAATCRAASGVVLLDNLSGTMTSAMLADTAHRRRQFHGSGPGHQPQPVLQSAQLRDHGHGQQRDHDGRTGEPDAPRAPQRRCGAPGPAHRLPSPGREGLPGGQPASAPRRRSIPGAPPGWSWDGRPQRSCPRLCGVTRPGRGRPRPSSRRRASPASPATPWSSRSGPSPTPRRRQHPFVQWWWDTHQSNPVTIKDLAPVALGRPRRRRL